MLTMQMKKTQNIPKLWCCMLKGNEMFLYITQDANSAYLLNAQNGHKSNA